MKRLALLLVAALAFAGAYYAMDLEHQHALAQYDAMEARR